MQHILTLPFYNVCDDNASYSIRPLTHKKIEYNHDQYALRAPESQEELNTYHTLRLQEIHNRYCFALSYNRQDPEEHFESNFPFILIHHTSPKPIIIGVIRVDLYENGEAAFRWVAISKEHQRKGCGSIMVNLAEAFVRDKNRHIIRVPAEEDSHKFYKKLGYTPSPWTNGPKNSGNIFLAKKLSLNEGK